MGVKVGSHFGLIEQLWFTQTMADPAGKRCLFQGPSKDRKTMHILDPNGDATWRIDSDRRSIGAGSLDTGLTVMMPRLSALTG